MKAVFDPDRVLAGGLAAIRDQFHVPQAFPPDVIAAAEAELKGRGRLVIRASGTEPVIRVMAEGDDKAQVETVVDRICDAVRVAAG